MSGFRAEEMDLHRWSEVEKEQLGALVTRQLIHGETSRWRA
jgi:hypothetical protein